MNILERYVRTDFKSYEDFYENYSVNVPEDFNFAYDVIDELAAQSPDKPALVWCNDKGDERTFTFAEMKLYSDRAANFLVSQGIGKGDMVMLVLKRHYQYWFLVLALHKVGAVVIPATHQLTEKDVAYRIEAAGIKMIIATHDDGLLRAVDAAEAKLGVALRKAVVGGEHPGYVDFDAELDAMPDAWLRPADLTVRDHMLIYFTSGTTGMPKMVLHDFSYPLGHILTAKFWQDLRPTDLHLTVADTGWAKASWGKIYGQWMCEAAIFVYDYDSKFQPIDLISVIAKHGVTTFCAPPTIFRFLIKEDLTQFDLSSLRACYIAGEPLNAEVFKQWKIMTGIEMREGFGQSETSVMVANFKWLSPKPGATGRPSPSYGIKILDADGNGCPPGDAGELCVTIKNGHPPGLFLCYYKDEQRTGSVMYDGYYHTGDMVWMDEAGYVWFVGRADDVIKSSGYRIGPFEVESALLEHPAVLETAITAVPDPERGQIVKATVVLARGYEASEGLKRELQQHVKRVTAPYKYPRIVEFVPELPKTISGKIKRIDIRNRDKESK